MDFAWLIWQRNYAGEAVVRWLTGMRELIVIGTGTRPGVVCGEARQRGPIGPLFLAYTGFGAAEMRPHEKSLPCTAKSIGFGIQQCVEGLFDRATHHLAEMVPDPSFISLDDLAHRLQSIAAI